MMVLIVAKTRVADRVCVGGLALETKQGVRLHQFGLKNQPRDTEYAVGQIWDMTVQPYANFIPLYIEDVTVIEQRLKARLGQPRDVGRFLLNHARVQPWTGILGDTFDGCVRFTLQGSAYTGERQVPPMSTGFWVSDRSLRYFERDNRVRYLYGGDFSLPYVGLEKPVELIPAGTLTRLSLARWWPSSDGMEERCFLQLSGWF